MRGRSPSHSTHDDYEDAASPASTRLLFVAMGIAMVIGLICGVIWTVYHLLHLQFLS
jgi:hypothetical protein